MAHKLLGRIVSGSITDLNVHGHGVLRRPGEKVVFVMGGWPGDSGDFEITEEQSRYCVARILRISAPAPDRVAVACSHFGWQSGQCTNCLWLGISYAAQIDGKMKMFRDQWRRQQLAIESLSFIELWPSPKEYQYRNRASFKTDGKHLGYLNRFSKNLVPISRCEILSESVQELFDAVIDDQPKLQSLAAGRTQNWTSVDLYDGMSISDIKSNEAAVFRQANTQINSQMKAWLRAIVSQWTGPTLELFCGSGNFTAELVDSNNLTVVAVDAAPRALVDLKNCLPQVTPIQLNLLERGCVSAIEQKLAELKFKPRNLILNPPRSGWPSLSEFLNRNPQIRELILINCDLSHVVREIKSVLSHSFVVQPGGLVLADAFPQTPHAEVLCYARK